MLKKILIALGVVVIAFAVVATMQPEEFRVSRSTTVAASVDRVFPQVNQLQSWKGWSPWIELDPNAENIYEGPAEGVGSVLRWSGNSDVGKGSMTITESRLNEFIKFRLDFLSPMQATHTAEFTFSPSGGETTVTWSMYGKNDFIGKAMSLIFNCDKMVGGQFERGLAKLKGVIEGAPR